MDFALLRLEIATGGLAMLVLMLEVFLKREDKRFLGYVGAVGVAFILFWSFIHCGWHTGSSFDGMWVNDGMALFLKRLFLVATILILIMSVEFAGQLESGVGEFFALILFACTGMLLTASANNFIMLFVSLETVTVSFYILTCYLRRQTGSLEAGVKYLILGAFSSALMVYGITFIYGTSGTLSFVGVAKYLTAVGGASSPLLLGVLLLFAGLAFKVASVPFQLWVPDVYQGSPTPVTAFLAVGSKAAGFALLLRVLFVALLPIHSTWILLIGVLAALTLLYGNLAAIPQKNLKRLLGYSSISHAGFLLLGVAAANVFGVAAVLFYLFAYAFTTLAAFMVIICLSSVLKDDEISSYAGLSKRSPYLAAAMTVALASLAGVPPMAGFFAKFLIFSAILSQEFWCLAILGAIGVVASLYYYLNIVRVMYWNDPVDPAPIAVRRPMKFLISFSLLMVIGLGVFPGRLAEWAFAAANGLLPLADLLAK